jgi:hypothetical protein
MHNSPIHSGVGVRLICFPGGAGAGKTYIIAVVQ